MEKKVYEQLQEIIYTETLDNGLKVTLLPKNDFHKTYGLFSTNFGSIDNQFVPNGKTEMVTAPDGIAHFLEHKLFETKGDDMMNAFSAMGADVNAFTSYRETVYYFSITGEDVEEPLNLLLDFVQDFNITPESVEKEKGIIAQEVAMYAQMPDQKLLNETYKCLYYNFPMKYDIGGDKKSIYAITKNELEECYTINYHPSNMVV
ncbi:EF-P 5-aminopentanol modification-associated protein YfmH, partial [Carnobacterium sp.]|uniref:EF-P 5-aminopentanol modification-associated protein YfmH n=1 Tax=Carnobacterium sp. TaxID=48221 RepID=UPI00388EBC56